VTNPTLEAADEGARRTSSAVATPGAKRAVTRRFKRALVDQQRPGGFDRAELFEAAREAIGNSIKRGPEGAKLNTEIYLDLVEARQIGISSLEKITDGEYELARSRYRLANGNYRLEQPVFARDPEIGGIFEKRTESEEMNSSCIDLVTYLGFEWITKKSPKVRPPKMR
jgi:hypothetical protein